MTSESIIKILNTGLFSLIIGAVLSVALYYAGRKRKILVYSYKQNVIVKDFKNEINGLEIRYDGNLIKDLTSTSIAIWNKGRDPIKRDDVAPKAPIQLLFKEVIVGEPTILFEKTPSNQVKLRKENRKIIVDFDFLDFEDGVVIQVFHTSRQILEPIFSTYSVSTLEKQLNSINLEEIDFEAELDRADLERLELQEIRASTDKVPFLIKGKIIGSQEEIKLANPQNLPIRDFFMELSPYIFFSLVALFFLKLFPALPWVYRQDNALLVLLFSIILPLISLPWFIFFDNKANKKANKRVVDNI